MKKVAFTLYGKEKVLNKTRNIYVRTATAATATKYVKYKGEFVKLKEFVKNKNKKIIVKTIKKDGALFFIYKGLKGLKGGGGQSGNPLRFNRDENTKSIDTIRELNDNDKGILYDNICNFEYQFMTTQGDAYHLRPFVDYKEGAKIFFKLYIAYDGWRMPSGKLLWVEIPIHITQFFGKTTYGYPTHIHITSEPDKLITYNIFSKIYTEELKHIYLLANSIQEFISIIIKYGIGHIFNNWKQYYQGTVEYRHVVFHEYYTIEGNRWKRNETLNISDDAYRILNPSHTITDRISNGILECINNILYRVLIDIFSYIIDSKKNIVIGDVQVIQMFNKSLGIPLQRIYGNSEFITRYTQRPQPSKSPIGKENKHPTQRLTTQRLTTHSPVKKTTLSKRPSHPLPPSPPSPPKLPR